MIDLKEDLMGKILDIGGGGEGVIGRRYRQQVIAIDNSRQELDEAPDCFEKIYMDAVSLRFPNAEFDHITFFFSLMFMTAEEQRLAIAEAARVVKPGGMLHIWDCAFQSACPEPFSIDVQINLPQEQICTTYGIVKSDSQSAASIHAMCIQADWKLLLQNCDDGCFYFKYVK